MSFPQRGYDTIFHYNMRSSMGSSLYKSLRGVDQEEHRKLAKNNEFLRTDAMIYMAFHLVACCVAILTSLPSFWYVYFHAIITLAVTAIVIYNGAKRYTYYITKLYSRMMEEALNEVALEADP
ncbi:unnamed protein product [Prorocentrum cordatum]|uniref:Glycerophosphocholine acyltransferase 1 n=1 Tax=Prorocentrum cordatum TaxID=2364126 RepID=A0ABN9YH37_9DINO|nr:unnamed protein product [Polarella glacialis]